MSKLSKDERERLQRVWHEVGGLSRPGKMPGYAWGIPATSCITGAQMAQVNGSVCNVCYALRNRYKMPNVIGAYQRRLERWRENPHAWEDNMMELLDLLYRGFPEKTKHFRWFDSGDLQSAKMLEQIIDVAWVVPNVKFWLPTREYSMVKDVLADHAMPPNLNIRLSAHMKDRVLRLNRKHFGDGPITTSAVATGADPALKSTFWQCPALKQENKCQACRACWERDVPLVVYAEH